MAQETIRALDPKPTEAERAAEFALVAYLGAEVYCATLAYLLSELR